jgi:hypothetical protein
LKSEFSPITDYILTDHAQFEMARRGIGEDEVVRVLSNPGQVETVRPGRIVLQSQLRRSEADRIYLLRVFVDIDCQVPEVVTVYRTSKIRKYWRTET